jgi:hypothetical protein
MKKNIFIIITSLLFISRFLLFVSTQDVGVEHDSGWYLGVARNVAERGMYASYTNTISTTEKIGGFPSIHNRFSVQDKMGFVYFPAGVTVGPGYILPEAFLLKVFGYGWVQFRLWPFLAFCMLIPVLFILVLHLSSFVGLLFFQLWLWSYPQLFLTLSFEAFSEHIALLFLLFGFVFFQKWFKSQKNIFYILLSGLSFGLSLQTKNLYLLGSVFSVISLLLFSIKTKSFRHFFIFIFFLSLPSILFELYRFFTLLSQFGFAGWWANNIDIKRTWASGGSGISFLKSGIPFGFIFNKLIVWRHVGMSPFLFAWPLIIISPFIHKKKTLLYWNIFVTLVIFFTWFALLSTTGWFRHIFPGVIMGTMIISLSMNDIILILKNRIKKYSLVVIVIFFGILYVSLILSSLSYLQFPLLKNNFNTLFKAPSPNKIQGPQFAPVFSKSNQDQIVNFLSTSTNKRLRICFYEWALIAELPPLVDRVFFPYPRCKENDLLIIGPYQKGSFAINNVDVQGLIQTVCKNTTFTNPMYTVCVIKKN